PKAVREPHWHSNANELSYCLEGKGAMTIFTPTNHHETFTFEAGESFFVPQNYLHHIENTGNSPLKILLSFNHEMANSNEMSSGFQKLSENALSALFKQSPSYFNPFQKENEPAYITLQSKNSTIPASGPNL